MASLRPSNHRNNNRNPNSATGGKFLTLSMEFDQKSDNLQYNTLVRWFAGTNDSSTKHLIFFFHNFFAKIVSIYFLYKFTKIKIKSFEYPKSIRNEKNICLEHQMLGRRFICPSKPANQRIIF